MTKFCMVARDLTTTLARNPDTGDVGTPEDLRHATVSRLEIGIAGVTAALEQLSKLGPSYVEGADRAVADLTRKYSESRELFAATRDKANSLPDGFSEADIGRIIGESKSMPTLSILMTYPFEGIQLTPAMHGAGDAPVCLSELQKQR